MLHKTIARRFFRRVPLVLLVSLAAAALTQSGCTTISEFVQNGFKVGPEYTPPPAPLPKDWIDANDPKVRVGEPNLCSWWDVFEDPILTKLIHEAYENNLTVRAAASIIQQAEIARFIAKSELLPQAQNALAGYSRNMLAETNGTTLGPGPSFGTGLAPSSTASLANVPSTPIAGATPTGTGTTFSPSNFGVGGSAGPGGGGSPISRYISDFATSLNASWELDFWGLFRRNVEAASASLDQSVHNYDEMMVLLLANVATQYVEIRTLQRRLELARSNVALQIPLVDAYQKRFKAGINNAEPGYLQLLSNLENTKALIPSLEISLRQANNQLCNLIGQPIHDLLPEFGDGTVPDPKDPKDSKKRTVFIPRPKDLSVVVAIPGDYLLRRPDVKASEDQMKLQSAQIGIAEAEMLPHLGINGSIGLASNEFNHLFEGKSFAGNIGPSLTWNILNYGRLLANVRFQNEQYRQFVATYQQAILNANQDAENSLIAYLRSITQADHLQLSADAAARATAYLQKQLREGYLPSTAAADTGAFVNQLFTLINFQVTQQDAAAQAEGNIALNLILVYRAMGGGWQIRLKDGQNCGDRHCSCDDGAAIQASQSVPEGAPWETLPAPWEIPPKPKQQPAPTSAPKDEPRVEAAKEIPLPPAP